MSTDSPPTNAVTAVPADSVTGVPETHSSHQNPIKLKLEDLSWDHSCVRKLSGDPQSDIISTRFSSAAMVLIRQHKFVKGDGEVFLNIEIRRTWEFRGLATVAGLITGR